MAMGSTHDTSRPSPSLAGAGIVAVGARRLRRRGRRRRRRLGDDARPPAATVGARCDADESPGSGELRRGADGRRRRDRSGRRPRRPPPTSTPTLQVPGQAIAIEARATLEADDVKAAVDRVTTTVTTRGGRVAAADVDYGRPPAEDDGTTTATAGRRPRHARAGGAARRPARRRHRPRGPRHGPVLRPARRGRHRPAGRPRHALDNMRASVERVRALYAEAVDIDSVVRLEAELTRRETDLEVLLATQSALEDRVTMSTLTLDITRRCRRRHPTTTTRGSSTRPRPGGVRSSACCSPSCSCSPPSPRSCSLRWSSPFGLAVHRSIVRRRPPATPVDGVSPRLQETDPERVDVTASRPG